MNGSILLSITYSFILYGDYYVSDDTDWTNKEKTEVSSLFNKVESCISGQINTLNFSFYGAPSWSVYAGHYLGSVKVSTSPIFIQNNGYNIFQCANDVASDFDYLAPNYKQYFYPNDAQFATKTPTINKQTISAYINYSSAMDCDAETQNLSAPVFNKIYISKTKDTAAKTITYTKTFYYVMRYGWNSSWKFWVDIIRIKRTL